MALWWLRPPTQLCRVLGGAEASLRSRNGCALGILGERGLSEWVAPTRQPWGLSCLGTCPHPPQVLSPRGGPHFTPQLPAETPSPVMGFQPTSHLHMALAVPVHRPLFIPDYSVGLAAAE